MGNSTEKWKFPFVLFINCIKLTVEGNEATTQWIQIIIRGQKPESCGEECCGLSVGPGLPHPYAKTRIPRVAVPRGGRWLDHRWGVLGGMHALVGRDGCLLPRSVRWWPSRKQEPLLRH